MNEDTMFRYGVCVICGCVVGPAMVDKYVHVQYHQIRGDDHPDDAPEHDPAHEKEEPTQ